MTTLNQIINNTRKKIIKKSKSPALKGAPLKKAVCVKTAIMKPKKPNSAQRKIAKVKFANNKTILVYIPGIGHNITEHSVVLIRGGRVPDLPGIKYKILRGKYDASPVKNRKTSRSLYGVKKGNSDKV